MAKFNYDKAKLVTIFLSQVDKEGKITGMSQENSMFKKSANGYIICPVEFEENDKQNIWNIYRVNLDNLVKKVSSLIKTIVNDNPNAKIWIGTPGIDSNCFSGANTNSTRPLFMNYLAQVKNKLDNKTWTNNIYGIYYNQESIYTPQKDLNLKDENGNDKEPKIAFSTEAEYTKNTQVQLMNDFAYEVREKYNLDLIWIPYYAREYEPYKEMLKYNNAFMAENIKRIAYIVHRTTIFDAVFLQANYKDFGKVNFPGIIKSVDTGFIYYRDCKEPIFSASIRECKIGAEVEWNTDSGEDALKAYTGRYAKYVDNKPLAFYWAGNVNTAISGINIFYDPNISGELDGNVNIPCETGYTVDKTYESNYVLKKGDIVKFNYDFSITPPYVEPERTEWEALQDFVFNINDKNYGITAGARYENQNYYFSFNYNESDSNEYSDSVVFEAGEELDGKKLSLYINLPRMSVYGGSFGVDLSYEIYVNDIRIV